MRLACQLRPQVDLTVQPLLHPSIIAATLTEAAQEFGEEREVTILFVDIRGSTSLAEARLPYDVIFLLNALFAALAEAVEKSAGYSSTRGRVHQVAARRPSWEKETPARSAGRVDLVA